MPMHPKVTELVLANMGLEGRDTSEIAGYLDEVVPGHGLDEAEIAVLWSDYSTSSCASWLMVEQERVQSFARRYDISPADIGSTYGR